MNGATYECPACHRDLMGPDEACNGSFTEQDHPSSVKAVPAASTQPPSPQAEVQEDIKAIQSEASRLIEKGITGKQSPAEPQGDAVELWTALQEINEYDVSPEVQKILDAALLGGPPAANPEITSDLAERLLGVEVVDGLAAFLYDGQRTYSQPAWADPEPPSGRGYLNERLRNHWRDRARRLLTAIQAVLRKEGSR